MKIAGHTMGTPHLSLEEAMTLFENIGLEGIEIICRDDYRCGVHPETTENEARSLLQQTRAHHLDIACLTPYITDLGSLDKVQEAQERTAMRQAILLARWLECPAVRTYGGSFFPEEGEEMYQKKRSVFVHSMRELGSFAHDLGVCLVVENHFSTLTFDARHTMDIVSEIDHPGVGILYDQANLGFVKAESPEQAIALQGSFIRYVHAKDFIYTDDRPFQSQEVTKINASDRTVQSRVIGEGIVPWPLILQKLNEIGYRGFYSLEYEYWRYPDDLPPPEIGMKNGYNRLKQYEQEMMGQANPPGNESDHDQA